MTREELPVLLHLVSERDWPVLPQGKDSGATRNINKLARFIKRLFKVNQILIWLSKGQRRREKKLEEEEAIIEREMERRILEAYACGERSAKNWHYRMESD